MLGGGASTMTEDLRFVPLIEQALRAPDPKAALLKAFAQIKAAGEGTRPTEGPSPFDRFMDAVVRQAQSEQLPVDVDMTDIVRELMVELATNGFEGDEEERQAALDLIQSRPTWHDEYDALVAEARGSLAQSASASVSLERAGEAISTWPLETVRNGVSATGITPGTYRLKLDSGRVIWQGDLTEREVVWTRAHPGEPLGVAATRDAKPERPTLEANVLEGELILRVFPRLESGLIEVVRGTNSGVA